MTTFALVAKQAWGFSPPPNYLSLVTPSFLPILLSFPTEKVILHSDSCPLFDPKLPFNGQMVLTLSCFPSPHIMPEFQSTLPHGERQPTIITLKKAVVSIHAPTRGATMLEEQLSWVNDVSIHAPARGATHVNFRSAMIIRRFNPRSRTGSDLLMDLACFGILVSIHAPARGATWLTTRHLDYPLLFQSTLPHGERHHLI